MSRSDNENHVVCVMVMYPEQISWNIQDGENIQSGSDLLSGTNGCYDSLLSNVLNRMNNYGIDEFIIRRHS